MRLTTIKLPSARINILTEGDEKLVIELKEPYSLVRRVCMHSHAANTSMSHLCNII